MWLKLPFLKLLCHSRLSRKPSLLLKRRPRSWVSLALCLAASHLLAPLLPRLPPQPLPLPSLLVARKLLLSLQTSKSPKLLRRHVLWKQLLRKLQLLKQLWKRWPLWRLLSLSRKLQLLLNAPLLRLQRSKLFPPLVSHWRLLPKLQLLLNVPLLLRLQPWKSQRLASRLKLLPRLQLFQNVLPMRLQQ
ncbi:hypothetical protein BDR26DRAFT_69620 [Obelidium mucronatum]|nr:hypothetical protein BDR26DRAFT_69620 [Obelidium mucronatum]